MDDQTWKLFHRELASSYDRIQEAHWWLHHVHEHYHDPNEFRWSLNAFVRAVREVDLMLKSELRDDPTLTSWYRERVRELADTSPLLAKIVDSRNIIVHREMLKPQSSATVGIWTGHSFRFAFHEMQMSPFQSTEEIGRRLLDKPSPLLWPAEDEAFAIERTWRVEEWGTDDVLVLTEQAWEATAQVFGEAVEKLGGTPLNPELTCMHDPARTRVKIIGYGAELPDPDWGDDVG